MRGAATGGGTLLAAMRGMRPRSAQWWTFLEQRGEADGWREVGVPAVAAFLSWLRNGRTCRARLGRRDVRRPAATWRPVWPR